MNLRKHKHSVCSSVEMQKTKYAFGVSDFIMVSTQDNSENIKLQIISNEDLVNILYCLLPKVALSRELRLKIERKNKKLK